MDYLKENKKMILAFLLGLVIGFEGSWLALRERADGPLSIGGDTEELEGEGAMKALGITEDEKDVQEDTSTGAPQSSGAVVGGTGVASLGGNVITATDQGAGTTVSIDSLSLEKSGWVAIYEDERGRPGKILGAQRFPTGIHRSVSVELLRAMAPGAVYYAVVHEDDGVDSFDHTKDLPITSSSGPLMDRFETKP